MSDLADRECSPCQGGVAPLSPEQIAPLHRSLDGWEVVEAHHLTKTYRFADFASALDFTNRVGALAEDVNHHPDIHLAWGRVTLEIWTHKIDGLAVADFVFAARCDRALAG